MKYSIVVPIYKVEAFLVQCIESVVNQEYQDWELILVDDGSPDNCPSICDHYAETDNRIKVVHKQNGGLVSARKAGLELASGDYALCLDGDDFYAQDCLQKVNEIVEEYRPDVVCYGYYRYRPENVVEDPIRYLRFGYYDKAAIEKEILDKFIYTKDGHRLSPAIWAKAYKIELYRTFQLKVSSEIGMGEDRACTYPIICNASSIYLLPDLLCYYRQVDTSMTKSKKTLSWDNYDRLFKCYQDGMGKYYDILSEQIWRHRTHVLFDICVSQFYEKKRNYLDTIRCIKQRFKDHPEYDYAISHSCFASFKMKLARFTLKHKIYLAFYLFSKIK